MQLHGSLQRSHWVDIQVEDDLLTAICEQLFHVILGMSAYHVTLPQGFWQVSCKDRFVVAESIDSYCVESGVAHSFSDANV